MNKKYSSHDIKSHQKRLFKYIQNKNDVVTLSEIMYHFSPDEFEYFIAYYYEVHKGFSSKVQGGYDDEGVDVICLSGKKELLIQCKKYITSNVDKKDIGYFYGLTSDRQNNNCELVYASTSRYTPNAKKLAKEKSISILDYKNIVDIANEINWIDFSFYMGKNGFNTHVPVNKRVVHQPIQKQKRSSYFDSVMSKKTKKNHTAVSSYFDNLMKSQQSIVLSESETYFDSLMKKK